jgi:hypothetical protein
VHRRRRRGAVRVLQALRFFVCARVFVCVYSLDTHASKNRLVVVVPPIKRDGGTLAKKTRSFPTWIHASSFLARPASSCATALSLAGAAMMPRVLSSETPAPTRPGAPFFLVVCWGGEAVEERCTRTHSQRDVWVKHCPAKASLRGSVGA